MDRRPIIGLTADVQADRLTLARGYLRMVDAAGGIALILPPQQAALPRVLDLCDGFILSGGDDPDTRAWGVPLHPSATLMDPDRQAFEIALLDALDEDPDRPVLGICLGMQLMALHAGGHLDQHLPDTLATAADHWGRGEHRVDGALRAARVHSHHRQAISDAGRLEVVAVAHDDVIEAVQDRQRRFFLGVQWHPERSGDPAAGLGLFQRLIQASLERAAGGCSG